MLSPIRDKNEGTYRGGEGTTPVTTQKIAEGKTSYELSWKGKVMTKKKKKKVGGRKKGRTL